MWAACWKWPIGGLMLAVSLAVCALPSRAALDLPERISQIKPAVVAVGTFQANRSPPFLLRGTGFAVGDGRQIVTNSHVVPELLNSREGEYLVVQLGAGTAAPRLSKVSVQRREPAYDLALLRLEGEAITTLPLQPDAQPVREGEGVGFVGFPIGTLLGLTPVTHRGIISAITPIALPGANSRQLNERQILRLRSGTFEVYQLDATAYPGNSGGPLFSLDTGQVIGVLNMVFVKGSKEAVLSQPSGISFAIPARYIQQLLRDAQTQP
ncbi:S1C family serine protease [Chitinimonas taiwanensis]|uniref:Trypsin-like peptidase domain-containing protein n=1 Tax=Chitinimonas taiwanensis DSM 18899 TaxID=1121279 RepID=A0A1K2HEP5_9NEIS|nr:serine protease [Chitinimonas taiwanensis]SFZ74985.1 Trypsin-like peptidase domain-containing protein [Chitinimonas taiwanensis DSM 18899]